jgi:hypothetical protein
MLKTKLAISLAVLALITPGRCTEPFLSSLTTELGVTTVPVDFSPALQCGECVLGGYIFCVNGVEGYSGKNPQRGICCQNDKGCPQMTT